MSTWTIADAYELLAVAQSFDRRTVGDFDAEGWRRAMHGLHVEDAKQAVVEHFTASTDWLMPAHVRQGVMRIRRDRLDRAGDVEPPDADPDDPIAYQRALQGGRRRAADGTEKPRDMRAIGSTFQDVPEASAAVIEAARRAIPPRRPAPSTRPSVDPEAMARARAELAAHVPVPTPEPPRTGQPETGAQNGTQPQEATT